MRKKGPLMLVEDDPDDQDLILSVIKEQGWENDIKICRNGQEALSFLYESGDQPFLILSDVNMPVMDGLTLKQRIDACDILSKKCIPFVFISTSPKPVRQVGNLNVQGFFEKGSSLRQLDETLKTILRYWSFTQHLS